MHEFQAWLWSTLGSIHIVRPFMTSAWGWPICESLHFVGLSMLIGCVGTFDLRLVGMAKRVPIAAMHRLIPWGIAGFVINVITGSMFLVTAPDQYIYNPSFHFKILFMIIAGINVAVFYLAAFGQVKTLGSGVQAPLFARVIGGASLFLWTGVIVFGRMLTFYRPNPCNGEPEGFLSVCLK